jgi:acetyltransferase-like isoleucine patch superfamily enzyme
LECLVTARTGETALREARQRRDTVWLQPPFYSDYGSNIHPGTRVFFNFNCIVLDVCKVRIGDYTPFGPAAEILTPLHLFDASDPKTIDSWHLALYTRDELNSSGGLR